MVRLRIVGDGERDAATVPQIVKGILHADFTHTASPWPRLHRGEKKIKGYSLKGHGLKLVYALTDARANGFHGLVATVDTDRSKREDKLTQMKLARKADRSQRAPLPTALGEATPHSEVWLLDDPVAVREGLGLPPAAVVPDVPQVDDPKSALQDLHAHGPRAGERPLAVWPDIATRVDPARCNHKKETGFEAFVAEVHSELSSLFARAG